MLVRVVKFCLSSHRVTLALRSHEKVEFFHTNWWACLMDRLHHTRYNGITISTVCGSKFTVVWQVTSLVTRPSEIKQMGKKIFSDSGNLSKIRWPPGIFTDPHLTDSLVLVPPFERITSFHIPWQDHVTVFNHETKKFWEIPLNKEYPMSALLISIMQIFFCRWKSLCKIPSTVPLNMPHFAHYYPQYIERYGFFLNHFVYPE